MSVAVAVGAAGRGQFIDPELDLPALGTALWRKQLEDSASDASWSRWSRLLAVQVITPQYQSESRVLVEGARQRLSAPGRR